MTPAKAKAIPQKTQMKNKIVYFYQLHYIIKYFKIYKNIYSIGGGPNDLLKTKKRSRDPDSENLVKSNKKPKPRTRSETLSHYMKINWFFRNSKLHKRLC